MLGYLLQGLTLGFAAAVQPGPFLAFLLTQVSSRGVRRTLPAVLAPLLSDGPIILLVVFVLNQVPAWFQRLVSTAGGVFILFLAFKSFQQWRLSRRASDQDLANELSPARTSLKEAVLMNVLGPGPYLFWSLVNGPILLRAWGESPGKGVSFLSGFYGAMITSLVAIILLTGAAQSFGSRVRQVFLGLSVLALTAFGFFQLYNGLVGN